MQQSSGQGATFVAGGAATGAWASVSIGGMGLSFSGTAVSIGLTPITLAGAIAGSASYGVFKAVIEGDASALSAATLGGLGGAGVSMTVGGMGLAFNGTAIGLGLAPITTAGAVVGLAVYGLLKIFDESDVKESSTQIFDRMEERISWQENYSQALREVDPAWIDFELLQKFSALEVEKELEVLKQGSFSQKFSKKDICEELEKLSQAISNDNLSTLKFVEFKDIDFISTTDPEQPSLDREVNSLTAEPPKGEIWQCIRTLKGHTAPVSSVAISPDGQTFATGSNDKTVKLWDQGTGKYLFAFLGQAKEVSTVSFSPDGKTLSGGSFDCKITIWDLKTKKFQTLLHQDLPYSHSGFVHSITFSPDGKLIISGGDDRAIKVWNRQTGKIIRTLSGHLEGVLSIAISADGQTLISGSADQTIKIWRCHDWETLHTLHGHKNWVFSVAISLNGEILASGSSDATVKLWNLKTGDLLHTLTGHSAGVFSVCISPDSQLIASGSRDGTIMLWHIETGELLQTLAGQYPIAFSPNGETLISGGANHTIKIWRRVIEKNETEPKIELFGEWWEILSVSPAATPEDVKSAYRKLARQHHPDINTLDTAKLNMQAIINAYREFRRIKMNH
jgi:hypothetical protein